MPSAAQKCAIYFNFIMLRSALLLPYLPIQVIHIKSKVYIEKGIV